MDLRIEKKKKDLLMRNFKEKNCQELEVDNGLEVEEQNWEHG